jgi:hypothetical protein
MNRVTRIFVLLTALTLSVQCSAQKTQKETAVKVAATKTAPVVITSYLGRSGLTGGPVGKWMFDSLLKQGVTAKDPTGNSYPVAGFTFSYAERNMYEDSVGNPLLLTDYFSEFCPGDTVSLAIFRNIFYKTKPGDTAYFDNVKVALPGGGQVISKPMKFVLTK